MPHAIRLHSRNGTEPRSRPTRYRAASPILICSCTRPARWGADPSRCVVIEDTPSGIEAAVAAGMRARGYSADSDEQALRRAGAETFRSLDELAGLLGL
jgi:beta-phosphoglucomutase-like phosphatase (HAD superfamily)